MSNSGVERKEKIEGKVAQVLNERELAINIGEIHGVSKGMRFAVLSAVPTQVKDPESGELLGEVDKEKIRVEAADIHPKFTICRTYKTVKVGSSSALGIAWALTNLNPGPPREAPETLRADASSLPRPLSAKESFVKINDRVVQVID